MLNKISKAIIAISSCVIVLCVPVLCLADDITAWKQGWFDGYRMGHADENVEWAANIAKYKELVDTIFDYKKLFLQGAISAVRLFPDYERTPNPDGSVVYAPKMVIKAVDAGDFLPVDYMTQQIKKADDALSVFSGWWVSVDTEKLSAEDKGFLRFIAMQNGFQPKVFKDRLIFSIERSQGDADRVAERLAKYKIAVEVTYVAIK